ncbi:MAG: glycosyltransferase [Terracidiphilus sp.]|jgi:glycosyltransferase involved in cell wall biosynthesis
MNHESDQEQSGKPRILLFSHKNIYDHLVWRCPFREFERIVQEVDSVDVLAPKPTNWYPHGRRVAARLGEFVSWPINPGIPTINVEHEYDMFITVCERVTELLHLKSLKGLRDKCKTTVCWLPEFYFKDIPEYKSCIEVLSQFDYVIFMFVANEPFLPLINGKSQYLPAGIDNLNFCPFPNPPARTVDVLSIGRRAPVTHKALMRMAREDGKFYVYDTIDSLKAHDLDEHRLMMANMAKRSRYFIVSPGKFDRPEETGGVSEFGYRYFEAASAGTIMLGMRPYNNKEFDKIFTWQDAVIEVPFTTDEIVTAIREFDKEPERQMKVRQTNITQCLLHHDWAYRWESILNLVGMKPLPVFQNRLRALNELASRVEEGSVQRQRSFAS